MWSWMNYVVLDMEWNDTLPKAKNQKGIVLIHEIIEIGAARMNAKKEITDTFGAYIKPRVYRRIREDVTELTGITTEKLEEGRRLKEVIEEFRQWCRDDYIILTWGSEDIPVLVNNLGYFGIDSGWLPFYFNAQAVFNMQTENKGRAFSLEYAMEYCGVEPAGNMHDALTDAVCTAKVCAGFDIEEGIARCDEYGGTEFGRMDVPMNMRREISFGFETVREAVENGFAAPVCPVCGKMLDEIMWFRINDEKVIADGYCREHDDYAVIISNKRLSKRSCQTVKSTYTIDRINEAYFDFVESRADIVSIEDI